MKKIVLLIVFILQAIIVLCQNTPSLIPYRKWQKWGYCTPDKKIVVDCIYDAAEPLYCGMARVKKDGQYGFIDSLGNEVIPCSYDYASDFVDGMAIVRIRGRYGFINTKDKVIITPLYYGARFLKDGMAAVKIENRWGVIDLATGKTLVACHYDLISKCSNGVMKVGRKDKYGFLDRYGREVIPCKYKGANFFYDNHIVVWTDDATITMDNLGRVIPSDSSAPISGYSEGLAIIIRNGKSGYVNMQKTIVISCEYDMAWPFSEGIALVKKDKETYAINKRGERVFKISGYMEVASFVDGYAKVMKDGKWGCIDVTGKEIIPCMYEAVGDFFEGLCAVRAGNKIGFIDRQNNMVINCKYSSTNSFENGLALVINSNRKKGYINKQGVEYWED